MMRLTLAIWWSLGMFWLVTQPLDAQPGKGKSVNIAENGWPREVQGYGLTASDAKQSAIERLLEDAAAFPGVPTAPNGDQAFDFASRYLLAGPGRPGPDFLLEKLVTTKTWIFPVRPLDIVRRQFRSEERVAIGCKVLSAATVFLAIASTVTWAGKRFGKKCRRITAAR